MHPKPTHQTRLSNLPYGLQSEPSLVPVPTSPDAKHHQHQSMSQQEEHNSADPDPIFHVRYTIVCESYPPQA